MELTDAHIDALQAQPRRIDIAVQPDFVLSVLPNGIKTWAHVYEHHGQLCRKTLGVYPDMGIEQARDAVSAARDTVERLRSAEAHAPAPVAPARPAARATRTRRRNWLPMVALAGVAIAAPVLWFAWEAQDDGAVPVVRGSSTPAKSDEVPAAAVATPDADRPAAAGDSQVLRGELDSRLSTITGAASPVATAPDPFDSSAEIPADSPATLTLDAGTPAVSAPDPATAAPEQQAAGTNSGPADDTEAARDIEQATQPPDDGWEPGPGLYSKNVARAILATEIEQREPVDELGATVTVPAGSSSFTLYFFTEVRGMSGQTLTHRWERNGTVLGERKMKVGAWRWRLYSSREIATPAPGLWTVSLHDEQDALLASIGFELRTADAVAGRQ